MESGKTNRRQKWINNIFIAWKHTTFRIKLIKIKNGRIKLKRKRVKKRKMWFDYRMFTFIGRELVVFKYSQIVIWLNKWAIKPKQKSRYEIKKLDMVILNKKLLK